MVASWRALSEEIGRGYQLTIYDYTNALSARDLLDEVLTVIPQGSVRSWVESAIEEADTQYRLVTHEVAKPIHGGGDMPWWYWRVPNRIEGELAEDLNAEGLLADQSGPTTH